MGDLVGKITDMEGMREEDDRDEIEDVSLDQLHSRDQDQGTSPSKCGGSDLSSMMSVQPGTGHVTGDPLNDKCDASMSQKNGQGSITYQPGTSDLDLTWDSDQDYDECVYYHEGSDIYAEDVDDQMAVLPEVPVTTEDTPEEIERLRQKIWKFRHLLIGKGNALPPAARGVVCDIDVGGARPIALKCRKLRIQFREKLADLSKGLLSAKMINYSRSPWTSPIVVIIKKYG
ncbi:reverse transcriptase, partial [Phytophthora megakarya]